MGKQGPQGQVKITNNGENLRMRYKRSAAIQSGKYDLF